MLSITHVHSFLAFPEIHGFAVQDVHGRPQTIFRRRKSIFPGEGRAGKAGQGGQNHGLLQENYGFGGRPEADPRFAAGKQIS